MKKAKINYINTPPTERFYSKEEWPKIQYASSGKVQRSIRWVESWLHYEGLKCVQDGQRYYLDPQPITMPTQVPASTSQGGKPTPVAAVGQVKTVAVNNALPSLPPGTLVRRFVITKSLRREEGFVPMIEMTEEHLKDSKNPHEYWELFLEPDKTVKDKYYIALRTYASKKRLAIYWEGVPPKEEINWELSPEQLAGAYVVKEWPEGYRDEDAGEETSDEGLEVEEDVEMSLEEGLAYLQLNESHAKLLEGGHVFLAINAQLFFITNIWFAYRVAERPKYDPEKEM